LPISSWAPEPWALEEGPALAAVRRRLVDDPAVLHEVERVEALAQLARLRVAHVDAVADAQGARGSADQGRLHFARALVAVVAETRRKPGLGQAVAAGSARGHVAPAERGHDAGAGTTDNRQAEHRGGAQGEPAVGVEERGCVEARA